MKYQGIIEAAFVQRLNRFVAKVELCGRPVLVHVKNTGRLKELLVPGSKVYLEPFPNPKRKYPYSLVSVENNGRFVNIDSQAPNVIVYEAIMQGKIHELQGVRILEREVRYGKSRFDLYYEDDERKGYIEVKGVTLAVEDTAMFPDAPTARGVKHLEELADAVREGYEGIVFFLLQMNGCKGFKPNRTLDPKFADALSDAAEQGVKIIAYDSVVAPDRLQIGEPVPVWINM